MKIRFLLYKIDYFDNNRHRKQGQNGTTIFNILDNTTELYMIKYTFGEIFNSGGATMYKNPSDQTVSRPKKHFYLLILSIMPNAGLISLSNPPKMEEFDVWDKTFVSWVANECADAFLSFP